MTSSQRQLWDYSIDDDADSPVPSCLQPSLAPSPCQSQSQSQTQASPAEHEASVRSTLATCEQVARGAETHAAPGTAAGLHAAIACYSTALGLLQQEIQMVIYT